MSPPTFQILYTRFTAPLPPDRWQQLLASLPPQHQASIKRYHFWQDQHRALFGKLLIIKGFQRYYKTQNPDLNQLQVSEYGRLSIPDLPDFNISHSGDYVICGFNPESRIGVDVEEIRPVDLNDFAGVMTEGQMKMIRSADDPMREFFRLWTLKESAIKANGKGLSIPLNELETDYKTVSVEEETWYLKELQLDEKHCAFLASQVPKFAVWMDEIDPGEFGV